MLRNVISNDLFTVLIVIGLILIAVSKVLFAKRFHDFILVLGNSKYLKIYSKDQKFLQTLFETEEHTDSLVEELEDNSFIALRVDGITESRIRDVSEVKQTIIDVLVADRQHTATEALVKDAIDQINAGSDLTTVATDLGLDVKRVNEVKRDGETLSLDKLPPVALSKLFTMNVDTTEYANTGTEFIVINAKSIKAADANGDSTGFDAIRSQLAVAISGDIMAQFNEALRDRHAVTINRAVLNDFQSRMQ